MRTITSNATRRQLVGGALGVGAALVLGNAIVVPALAPKAQAEEPSAQYGFLVDLAKCVGCERCVAACRQENHLSDDTPNRRTVQTFMDSQNMNVYVSTSCMHCAHPSCEQVCPAGAISKGEAGIVSTDKDRCIGCKYCFQACPYGVPNYNEVAMDKCDCCLDAGVAPGETPYCVRACIFDALNYGPIDELVAQAEGRATQVGEPNDPSCWLIGEVK